MYWSFFYVYVEWGEDSIVLREVGVGGLEIIVVVEEGGGFVYCRGGVIVEIGGF